MNGEHPNKPEALTSDQHAFKDTAVRCGNNGQFVYLMDYERALARVTHLEAALSRIMQLSSGTSATIAEKALKGYSGAG